MKLEFLDGKSVPFGKGTLTVEGGYEPWELKLGYGGIHRRATRLRYSDGKANEMISSMEEISTLIADRGVDLLSEISKCKEEWAAFLSDYLGIAQPLRQNSAFFAEAYAAYSVNASKLRTAFENRVLTWYSLKHPGPDGPAQLLEVTFAIDTLKIVTSIHPLNTPKPGNPSP